ncbi:hypothetical protein WA026_011395 [Henosepilachna vigintioctopunctata]|uniref:NF-kappa-B-activating protein C-terminal domain-containing protein n=1 Tax=Henosepilachna vigintioctopunctata TaxID=420089 RepID=A0AAW1TTP7_9CUCU
MNYEERDHKMKSRKRSRSRSPTRSRSFSRKPESYRDDRHARKYEYKSRDDHTKKYEPKKNYEEEYLNSRRRERELLGMRECPFIWGKSPEKESHTTSDDEKEATVKPEKHKKRKKKSKDKKKKKEKTKKMKKEKKKKRKVSSSSSNSSSDEEWVEKPSLTHSDTEETVIGPVWKPNTTLTHKEMGRALLPGEGAAMAAYVAEGKRIPRRGEIGLTSEQIADYESVGYVMSGSRHRRMEAVRIRKENQIYSADEKRALAMFSKEERQKRENLILGQFKDMVTAKLAEKKKD